MSNGNLRRLLELLLKAGSLLLWEALASSISCESFCKVFSGKSWLDKSVLPPMGKRFGSTPLSSISLMIPSDTCPKDTLLIGALMQNFFILDKVWIFFRVVLAHIINASISDGLSFLVLRFIDPKMRGFIARTILVAKDDYLLLGAIRHFHVTRKLLLVTSFVFPKGSNFTLLPLTGSFVFFTHDKANIDIIKLNASQKIQTRLVIFLCWLY